MYMYIYMYVAMMINRFMCAYEKSVLFLLQVTLINTARVTAGCNIVTPTCTTRETGLERTWQFRTLRQHLLPSMASTKENCLPVIHKRFPLHVSFTNFHAFCLTFALMACIVTKYCTCNSLKNHASNFKNKYKMYLVWENWQTSIFISKMKLPRVSNFFNIPLISTP